MIVRVRRFPGGEDLPLPAYATNHSAGVDLLAALTKPREIFPGQRMLIPTGIAVNLPAGYELQIRPRSGLAIKNGLTVLNSPGTIDEDYTGQISVILINLSDDSFIIEPGMRIAQAVLAPVTRIVWEEVTELEETDRGAGGFGSTGF